MFRAVFLFVCLSVYTISYASNAQPKRSLAGDLLDNKVAVQLQVIDTYLELHTGPGRGYPIFHVMEQGETVYVHSRRTNWFYVSDRRNRQGWVKQEGLARTLAPTGMPAALPDIKHGDFLAQQGRVGFSLGMQEKAETASITAGFRLLSFAGIEAEYGQIFGEKIDGVSYGASLLIEPIKSWSFTPFISKGFGRQEWQQKTKLQVGESNQSNSRYEYTGFGINYYIGFSFVVRGEFRKMYLVGDNDSLSNSAWRIGFSSFF